MDDRTFDERTALDWIGAVENPGKSARDVDIYPKLQDWVRRASPARVLDLGCGQGICANQISSAEIQYAGVDPSPFLVDRARKLYAGANREFVVGNVYRLPFSDSSFDAAFSILVWHLLEDLDGAAGELRRVLKPGGHFLIMTANPGA